VWLTQKSRMLQIINEREGLWEYELVDMIMKDYGLSTRIDKGNIRISIVELSANGLLTITDMKEDFGEYFGKGKVVYKYTLSKFGKKRGKTIKLF